MTARLRLRDDLRVAWEAALRACDGERVTRRAWRERFGAPRDDGRRGPLVVGWGKAAVAMALGTAAGRRGLLVAKSGPAPEGFDLVVAAHPVPDATSDAAGRALLASVCGLADHDVVVALSSGGGSSLLAAPVQGVTIAELALVNRLLLRSGVDVASANAVRCRLSRVAGGRLAAAAVPARVVTFTISDVPGDDPALVSSGPTAPPSSTREDALRVAARLPELPPSVLAALHRADPPPPPTGEHVLLATASDAAREAARVLRERGYAVTEIPGRLSGDAHAAAAAITSALRKALARDARAAVVGAGETTVAGADRPGGRNLHLAGCAALLLAGGDPAALASVATDGDDGTSGTAGGLVDDSTAGRACAASVDAAAALRAFDSLSLLRATGDTIAAWPARTNVGDLVLAAGARA